MNDYSKWKQKFLTIAAGQTVSLIGSSAVLFSLIWWLASETGSPMMMALSGLVAFLPQIFLGPFAGVLPEKYFAGIIRPYSAAKQAELRLTPQSPRLPRRISETSSRFPADRPGLLTAPVPGALPPC